MGEDASVSIRRAGLLRTWLAGGAAVAAALALGAGWRTEPFHTYLYLFAWPPFLAALFQTARLRGARDLAPDGFGFLFAASTTLWLAFELLNLRLENWTYHGVPKSIGVRWPGYALSFATVLPGLFWCARAIRPDGAPAAQTGRAPGAGSVLAGFVMLVLVLAWPRLFFPLAWGAGFFLFEPLAARLGGRSLIAEWRAGEFRWTVALLGAGAVCGFFWEACNFGAGAKWMYDVPFVGRLKLFEMPVLGFLGFPPFALEAHAMYEVFRQIWRRLGTSERAGLAVLTLAFWIIAFGGIDAFTLR